MYTENTFFDTTTKDSDANFDPNAEKKARKAAKAALADASSDDEPAKKSARGGYVDRYVPPPPPKVFPVYRPKSFDTTIGKSFILPGIKRKGILVETKLTNQALGTRRAIEHIPRPLHNPLEDHAIVLWDPTTDDRELERELEKERLEREVREQDVDGLQAGLDEAEKERRKVHRSLAEILGLSSREADKKRKAKVPVVIDPRVGKVLRPHQVEGVKFLYRAVTGMIDENAHGYATIPNRGFRTFH